MVKEEILIQKLRFLVETDLKEDFNIMRFNIEFEYLPNGDVSSYEVEIDFDYLRSIDFESYKLCESIDEISQKIHYIFDKYSISPKGKITIDQKNTVYDPIIWKFDYVFDEKHFFDMSITVDL